MLDGHDQRTVTLRGLLFGWVYERTGSLAAPIAIHIFHNGGMLFVASVVKSLVAQG